MERSSRVRATGQQTTPVSLGAAARRILRHKLVVVMTTLIFAALGAVAGLALPQSYEAKAVVNVTQPSAGASGLRAALSSIDMDTEEAIASSRVVLQAAADELGMDVADLKEQVTAAGHSNSTILDVIVNAKNPDEAADIANTVARAYLNHRSHTLRASREETRENIDAVSQGMDKSLVDQAILTLEATSTESGTIISEAQVPSEPSNFSLAQTIFIGAAMGLLLGLFLAYLVDRANPTLGYSERLAEISGSPVSVISREAEHESAAHLLRRIGLADGRLTQAELQGVTIFSPTPHVAASLTSLLTDLLTDNSYVLTDTATFNALGLGNLQDYIDQNAPVLIEAPESASVAKVLLAADHTRVLLLPFTSQSRLKSVQRLFDEMTPASTTQVIPVYFDTPTQK
ncbi:MAG: Wzz/FepE/Etk N-terminal domain-containing protein [Rothia sp. (in: high G+C Gram-positive bacteria)]|nr:Wzz/FepE/Etk N-terminal domain-containing protein [Rothia sp. (in: high G+C Gram-positive bacteria)]